MAAGPQRPPARRGPRRRAFPPAVACTFSCMMKFTVKDCDPTTGEADDEGYEDEYVVSAGGACRALGQPARVCAGFGLDVAKEFLFLT